jgi:hypothetical protein
VTEDRLGNRREIQPRNNRGDNAAPLERSKEMALTIAEMKSESIEFIPAREVMCGGCSQGGSYQEHGSSYNYDSNNAYGNGDGNGSFGIANGSFDGDGSGDTIVIL